MYHEDQEATWRVVAVDQILLYTTMTTYPRGQQSIYRLYIALPSLFTAYFLHMQPSCFSRIIAWKRRLLSTPIRATLSQSSSKSESQSNGKGQPSEHGLGLQSETSQTDFIEASPACMQCSLPWMTCRWLELAVGNKSDARVWPAVATGAAATKFRGEQICGRCLTL